VLYGDPAFPKKGAQPVLELPIPLVGPGPSIESPTPLIGVKIELWGAANTSKIIHYTSDRGLITLNSHLRKNQEMCYSFNDRRAIFTLKSFHF